MPAKKGDAKQQIKNFFISGLDDNTDIEIKRKVILINVIPEFCTIDLTEGGYHLGTFAIMGVTTPTHKSRRYPDGKIQEIKFPGKPQPKRI